MSIEIVFRLSNLFYRFGFRFFKILGGGLEIGLRNNFLLSEREKIRDFIIECSYRATGTVISQISRIEKIRKMRISMYPDKARERRLERQSPKISLTRDGRANDKKRFRKSSCDGRQRTHKGARGIQIIITMEGELEGGLTN